MVTISAPFACAAIACAVALVVSWRQDPRRLRNGVFAVLALARPQWGFAWEEVSQKGLDIVVLNWPEGGKSRTWNRFVHEQARPQADMLVFCDADIQFVTERTIENLLDFMSGHPDVAASSSVPIKDIDHFPQKLNLVEHLISASGGKLFNTRHAICGQLYAARPAAIRDVRMPVGLPVEDGFIRHMIITDLMSRPVDESVIDQAPDVQHVYESERKIFNLIRHQIRLVIGGAINKVVFDHLSTVNAMSGREGVRQDLLASLSNPDWLPAILRQRLPDPDYGWVPRPFLMQRLVRFAESPNRGLRARAILGIGFTFDLVVYVCAQFKMWRGTGVGYW